MGLSYCMNCPLIGASPGQPPSTNLIITISDTLVIQRGLQVMANRFTENNSSYYRLSLLQRPNCDPEGVH